MIKVVIYLTLVSVFFEGGGGAQFDAVRFFRHIYRPWSLHIFDNFVAFFFWRDGPITMMIGQKSSKFLAFLNVFGLSFFFFIFSFLTKGRKSSTVINHPLKIEISFDIAKRDQNLGEGMGCKVQYIMLCLSKLHTSTVLNFNKVKSQPHNNGRQKLYVFFSLF